MAIGEALYSSRSEEYGTPQKLYDALDAEFHFTLDPCASDANHKCAKYYTIATDGLAQSWAGERVFMNPPYGKNISLWMKKIATEPLIVGVALVHVRTDTRWWHEWVEPYATEIRFIKGRVRFEGAPYSAPFPSVIVVYASNQIEESYQPQGWVYPAV